MSLVGAAVAALLPGALHAQGAAGQETGDQGVFTLGQVTVTAPRILEQTSDDRVDSEEIWRFNTNDLAEAMLMVPGVSSTLLGGRRNEVDINVRGFDRWRTPVSIDGIRVYLPADNRLDMARFLTPDLAEVQVKKGGRASVIDGPGAMGGAINLVTRKPTKEFDAEGQTGAFFGPGGDYEGWMGTGIVGTNQGNWYAQVSGTTLRRDGWHLSRDFTPSAPSEDGGMRNGSDTSDWRVNAKLGFTPNATDEYSLSYTTQSGDKGAPLNVYSAAGPWWTWPWWDVQSLYWISNTSFGDDQYLKTRLYWNTFSNALFSWDDATYSSQAAPRQNVFQSLYDDDSYGASIEYGARWFAIGQTRLAVHWREDEHVEQQITSPGNTTQRPMGIGPLCTINSLPCTEPKHGNRERTLSLAAEQSWEVNEAVAFTGAISWDQADLREATEFNWTVGLFDQPTGSSDAFNWQVGATWAQASNSHWGASISSRTRFPTIFERFSTRFGNAVPNPDLSSERAINYEISWQGQALNTRFAGAVFYSDLTDMIQTVVVGANETGGTLTQTQNVGNGEYYGFEAGLDWDIAQNWQAGANYTYMHREIRDGLQPNLQVEGVPDHQAFLWLGWRPTSHWEIQPSIELASNRWSAYSLTPQTVPYVRTGSYELINLQVIWRPTDLVDVIVGGRNLTDENFQLSHGFPEPGRSLFGKVRARF